MSLSERTHVSTWGIIWLISGVQHSHEPELEPPLRRTTNDLIYVIPWRTDIITIHIGLWFKNCFLFIIAWKTIKGEEFEFVLYKTLLAGFSTITERNPNVKFWPSYYFSLPQHKNKIATSLQLPEFVPFLFFSSILTAIDRGTRLAGVPPGLSQGAAAGGATDAHPNFGVAGQASVSSRTELQVAVAHTVVCRATEELKTALAIVRTPC